MEGLYDVIAVNLESNRVRLIAENKSEANAEAIENMAVARRGVDEEFFVTVHAGEYKENSEWKGA